MPYNIGKKSQQIPQKHNNISKKNIQITKVTNLTNRAKNYPKITIKNRQKAVRCFKTIYRPNCQN